MWENSNITTKVGNWEIISDSDVNEKIDFKKKMMQRVSNKAPAPDSPTTLEATVLIVVVFSGPRQISTRSSLRAYFGYSSRRDTILMVWKT